MFYLIVKPRSNTDIENYKAKPNKYRSNLVLIFRWLIGFFVGFGISALVYIDFLNNIYIIPFPIAVPFIGQYYFFNYLIYSSTSYSNYSITFPAMIWGIIGALLISGKKNQIKIGTIALIVYVVAGIVLYFLSALLLVIT